MDEYEMLDNIRAHSLMVARVADVLLTSLSSTLSEALLPDRALTITGALLHDIAKTPCLDMRCDHARQGRDLCLKLGYPEVAEIVREHVILMDFSPNRYTKGVFLAKEIVYYADKRVRHDEIVSLKERLEYIMDRYGNNDPKRLQLIDTNFEKCRELEEYIFAHLTMNAQDIKEVVEDSPTIP
jgi:putative nucleotidyltransferase with HDIG domain